jgi:hypothetical protein
MTTCCVASHVFQVAVTAERVGDVIYTPLFLQTWITLGHFK